MKIRAWLYHLGVVLFGWIDDLRYRNVYVPPSVPCQFCGGNHREKYCPKAKEMGFLDDA